MRCSPRSLPPPRPPYTAVCELLIGTALLGLTRPIDTIDAFEKARTIFQHLAKLENEMVPLRQSAI